MVKCNECYREFPEQPHPYYMYCPWCDLFNVEIIGSVTSVQRALVQMMEMAKEFPNMLKPRYGTMDAIKDFIEHDERFNPRHVPLKQALSEVEPPLDDDTLETYIEAINMSQTMDALKDNIIRVLARHFEEFQEEENENP